jgi:uncharacterized protein YqeY
MTLEILQAEMIAAMKNKNKERKQVISNMIDSVKKASMTPKGRIEITEQLVDETLIKFQKLTQEQIDTCPGHRTDKREEYERALVIVKEFAPQLITDEAEIANMITSALANINIEPTKKNKGQIMKVIMPIMKGKADGKIVQKVINGMLEG